MSWLTIFVLVSGFVFLSSGAKLLCDSVVQLGRKLNINSIAIGVFLVSLGTAAPDFVSAFTAIFKGYSNISVGSILGSNFTNLTLGFGIASLIRPFRCNKNLTRVEFPLLMTLTILFMIFCFDGKLTRLEGAAFLAIFIAYIIFVFRNKKPSSISTENTEDSSSSKLWTIKKSCLIFLVSSGLLALGAHFVVTSCCKIAEFFKISQTFVGFSLLSLGTSAPEIFVVSTAARKQNHEICSGNIIGSNLINLMFVAGLCALIHPIILQKEAFLPEALALILVTTISWYIFRTKIMFSRVLGATFVALYFIVMFIVKK